MESNKKLSPTVNKLFLREKKTQYFTCFYITILFQKPKTIRLNETHYFIVKICSKRELQQIAPNHLPDNDFKDFIRPFLKKFIHFQ